MYIAMADRWMPTFLGKAITRLSYPFAERTLKASGAWTVDTSEKEAVELPGVEIKHKENYKHFHIRMAAGRMDRR
mgnify:CR=1 FL=1